MEPSTEFLTPEECAEVDKALLTSQDKFTTRVTLYALRSLKQIAQQHGQSIADLQPTQVEDWVYQDESLQTGIDREFRQFFAQLVISAQKPLRHMAKARNGTIEDLTLSQVISWFEEQAKLRLHPD
ncbi:MAG TPA: hypothetical protein V6D18_07975 [Thermosynechococcaceae cyanobacterium]